MTVTFLFPPSLGMRSASARAAAARETLARSFGQSVAVEVAPDYAELEAAVVSGTVDLAWVPPVVCAMVSSSVARIYKAVRSGESLYYGAIVARPELADLDMLRGTRPAWTDRRSAGGYLLPRSLLRAHGIDPEHDLSSPVLTGSYFEAIKAVVEGRADFATIYVHHPTREAALAQLETVCGAPTPELHVLAFTEPTASDGVLLTHGPHREVLANVVDRWCQVPADPLDAAAFACFDAEGFEHAAPGDYRSLRRAI